MIVKYVLQCLPGAFPYGKFRVIPPDYVLSRPGKSTPLVEKYGMVHDLVDLDMSFGTFCSRKEAQFHGFQKAIITHFEENPGCDTRKQYLASYG
jgi:hypothetical protein